MVRSLDPSSYQAEDISSPYVQSAPADAEPGGQGSLSEETTVAEEFLDLNNEEAHSGHMPKYLKCDTSRKPLLIRFRNIFQKDNLKSLHWEIYGIMEVNNGTSGCDVMMISGPWLGRLYKMYQRYLGELIEEEIYQEFIWNNQKMSLTTCIYTAPCRQGSVSERSIIITSKPLRKRSSSLVQ
uniref:Uncharacterized protein n=1 Tax=Callorhinchus milii TaxID=7868 RepID=A0A4W3JUB1_CALMI